MPAVRKLPSGLWQPRAWHPGLKRYVSAGKPHPHKKRAREMAVAAEEEIRGQQWIDPKRGDITLGEWWDIWTGMRTVEKRTLEKDLGRWRNHIQPRFGNWTLNALEAASEDVATWVADMDERGVGRTAAAGSLGLLSQMLGTKNGAMRHKRIRLNPCEGIKPRKVPKHEDRFLTRKEAKILRLCFAGVDRLMVDTFLETGLRWAELAGLAVYRVDRPKLMLRVRQVMDRYGSIKAYPKSDAGHRDVPLTPRLARRLARHIEGKPKNALVFTAPEGGPVYYATWRSRVWRPTVRRAGLGDPQPTIHDLRHTYGSWLAERGMPPPDIKDLMGHETLRSCERYLHAASSRFERARAALSSWHGVGTPTLISHKGGRKSGTSGGKKTRSDLRKDQSA